MSRVNIVNLSKPLPNQLTVKYCENFFCKLRGLTFRRKLQHSQGLLLVEKDDGRLSTAIHMLFVFFKLGIVWINSESVVVDKGLAQPWVSFLFPEKAAQFVLEIAPERLAEFQIGDMVNFEKIN